MKKRIPALLLAVMLLLALPVTASAAETELRIIGPSQAPAVGESFSITLELNNSPELCIFQTLLLYDSKKLECTEVKKGPALAGWLSAENPCRDNPTGAFIVAISEELMKAEGNLAEFHFRVLDEDAIVPRILYDTLLGDEDSAPLPFTVVQVSTDNGTTDPDKPEKPDKPEEPNGYPFSDIAGHKEEDMILRAAALGLFDGFPDGTFRPDESVTRAQFVMTLWRMAGKPVATKPAPFDDVPSDSWYNEAVAWAYETGSVNGRSETVFDPDGAVTRQEAAKILFYYAGGTIGLEALFTTIYDSSFTDSGEIADWAKDALYWGVYNGLIGESDDTAIRPTDAATRAELAKMLVVCGEKY